MYFFYKLSINSKLEKNQLNANEFACYFGRANRRKKFIKEAVPYFTFNYYKLSFPYFINSTFIILPE